MRTTLLDILLGLSQLQAIKINIQRMTTHTGTKRIGRLGRNENNGPPKQAWAVIFHSVRLPSGTLGSAVEYSAALAATSAGQRAALFGSGMDSVVVVEYWVVVAVRTDWAAFVVSAYVYSASAY